MLNRKNLTLIVLILMALISVRFFPGCGEGLNLLTNVSSDRSGSSGVDWTAWSYRRAVTISNSGSAQSDYQVNIVIENEPDFYTKAAANGDDIRFNYNGTSIPYWIELWDSGGTRKFSVWVKVPVVSNPESVVYLYYGNSGQSAESDFDNTFTKDSGFSGLAARWHMDEGSGISLDDSSANSNTGTVSASSLWLSSDGGRWFDRGDVYFSAGDSLDLGGADYVAVPDNDSLDPQKITICFWFNADSVTSGYLVSKWNTDAWDLSYAVFLNGNSIYFYSSTNGTSFNNLLQSDITVSTGTWYFIAAVYDGAATSKKIYINGSEHGTTNSVSDDLFNSNSNLTIGCLKVGGGNFYTGKIDEVSIYNTALSANQIKALSQRSKYSSTVSVPVVGSEELVP